MRLINTRTLRLQEFFDSEIPKYAILSHTWGREEITLQDFLTRRNPLSKCRRLLGYAKVLKACQAAIEQGFDHLWCDTCCIDKASSAELSEAINSMFRWYKNAARCLVYLEDFIHDPDQPIDIGHCKWLTRGWCLQELLAPDNITFYDKYWDNFATKDDLMKQLVLHTGIVRPALCGQVGLSGIPVAHRMSWAARRTTSRVEDQAYCLLGILGVNMPLLYGEGHGAFLRLQQEILRVHDDPSIFMWFEKWDQGERELGRMLAPDISCFERSGNIGFSFATHKSSPEFSFTNRGIHVKGASLNLWFQSNSQSDWHYLLPLWELVQLHSGPISGSLDRGKVYLALKLLKVTTGNYIRLPGWVAHEEDTDAGVMDVVKPEKEFHIVNSEQGLGRLRHETLLGGFVRFTIQDSRHPDQNIGLSVEPRGAWDSLRSGFFFDLQNKVAGFVKIHPVIQQPSGPSTVSFLIAFAAPPGSIIDFSDKQGGFSAWLIPSHVWGLYDNFSHSIERQMELATAHPATTKIRTSASTTSSLLSSSGMLTKTKATSHVIEVAEAVRSGSYYLRHFDRITVVIRGSDLDFFQID